MKTSCLLPFLLLAFVFPGHSDPLLSSWITAYSSKYARVYYVSNGTTGATSGPVSTWSNNQLSQTLPAYCGVQQIDYSSTYVYLRSTGLGSHPMGPWYDDATRTKAFVNLPVNQKDIFRLPRTPVVPTTKTRVQGEIGFFVDGVHAFDSSDATSYSNASAKDGDPPGTPGGLTGDGLWNRDAYVNEAITFDGALAHQQNTGVYHYHANPIAPRYLLGDHVDYNAATNVFTESTAAPDHHSPIVGWAKDGYPIYGPYGYATATVATSGVRRMVSGYVPRNGTNGTANLATTGRHTLPAWAVRVLGSGSTTLTTAQYGPNVGTGFPLGRYLEDNDYLGDLGQSQGSGFDLDEYNGRYCVTPEYPNGTYAYFVALSSSGLPTFPYNVGRRYYGTPSGGVVTAVTETVTNTFKGGPNNQEFARLGSVDPASGDVAVTWSSVEGGTYKIEASPDHAAWTALTTAKAAANNAVQTSYTESGAALANAKRFYRVTRTALATYDDGTSTGGGTNTTNGISSVSPTSSAHGATVTTAITLNASYNPAPPPVTVQPTSVTLTRTGAATIGAASYSRNTTTGVVTATFAIPASATVGAYTVNATFGPNTWSLANGFTVN